MSTKVTVSAEDFVNETIEDALETAVDYGFLMARWKYSDDNVPKRLVEAGEELFQDAAERLYLAVNSGIDMPLALKNIRQRINRLKRKP